jgi:hypothetical protein
LKKGELQIEPRPAERDLRGRWTSIAAAGRGLSRKAFRNGGAVWKMVLVDPGLLEPTPQLRARPAAERLPRRQLNSAGRLADDRDPVTNGPSDDRAHALEMARGDAFGASPDARVKVHKPETVGAAIARP